MFPSHVHLKLAVFVLSMACLGISLVFLSASPMGPVALRWRGYALVLMGVLAALSVAAFLARRLTVRLPVLAARLMLVILAGLPFGDWMALKVALWTSVCLEIGGYLDAPLSVAAQAVSLAAALLFQRQFLAWGQVVHAPAAISLAAASIWIWGLALLLHLLRRSVSIVGEKAEQLSRLDEAVRQLTVANLGFQRLASSAEERSAEDERKRITREIHDAIGYALTNLIMMMEAAMRLAPGEVQRLRELLAQAREEAQVGLNETRKALRLLRAAAQEGVHGLAAVHRLATLFSSATGVEVRTEYCNADQSFGEERDMVIYRMVQEGMTNAFRHGHATLIVLKFWQEESCVTITLWDNGAGGEEIQDGIGLQGMRERVQRVGGTLRAGRVLDGFELSARLPLGAAPLGLKERMVARG